jgi:hypothetical protein
MNIKRLTPSNNSNLLLPSREKQSAVEGTLIKARSKTPSSSTSNSQEEFPNSPRRSRTNSTTETLTLFAGIFAREIVSQGGMTPHQKGEAMAAFASEVINRRGLGTKA